MTYTDTLKTIKDLIIATEPESLKIRLETVYEDVKAMIKEIDTLKNYRGGFTYFNPNFFQYRDTDSVKLLPRNKNGFEILSHVLAFVGHEFNNLFGKEYEAEYINGYREALNSLYLEVLKCGTT